VTVTSEVTVTLTPAATLTASPTFTETPIPTLAPTLIPDQQTALDTAKIAYGDTGWEIQPSGEVLGAPEGVTYNVEKGVLEYTHESYGVMITEPLIINTEDSVKPEGVTVDLQGYGIDVNHNLVPKSFSSAEGKNIEGGQRLHSKLEAQLFLANPANVDMTVTEFDIVRLTSSFYKSKGKDSEFVNGDIREFQGYGWADDKVYVSDGKGGFEMKKTTVYFVLEFVDKIGDKNVTIIYYTDHEGLPKFMLVDSGAPVPDDTNNPKEWSNPTGWSKAFEDPNISVRWH
jgi:hypothetical protein